MIGYCCQFNYWFASIMMHDFINLRNVIMEYFLFFFQLLRKRHIGNDIVTIVFQEPGALPFSPKTVRSQFQHVFIIVRTHNPCSDKTHYR